MNLILKKRHLLAAAECAADPKDARFYLRSVCLEFSACGHLYIVGTCDLVLFAGRVQIPDWLDAPQNGPFVLLIPADVIARACKGKKPETVNLISLPDGRYMLGDVVFAAGEGTYPNWRRIAKRPPGITETLGQYNPELLALCQGALRAWIGNNKPNVYFEQYGTSPGVMTIGDPDCFAVIGAMRIDKIVDPFIPYT